jgi:hypothetical protein
MSATPQVQRARIGIAARTQVGRGRPADRSPVASRSSDQDSVQERIQRLVEGYLAYRSPRGRGPLSTSTDAG